MRRICRFGLAALALLLGGCVLTGRPADVTSATGTITGQIVDAQGNAVAGASVEAIYLRGWTTLLPPTPNAFIVATARTGKDGVFTLATNKRVDQIEVAESSRKASFYQVRQTGNTIRLE